MLKELLNFNRLKEFVSHASNLVALQMTIWLPFVVSTLLIGQLGDSVAYGAYGLTTTFISMFFSAIILGAQEHLGSRGAKFHADNDKEKLAIIFWKSVYYALVVDVFYVLIAINSEKILIFIGISHSIVYPTARLLRYMIPYTFLHSINQMFQNFLSAQQIIKPFKYLNVMSLILIITLCKVFILDLNYRELGFAYASGIQELFNFLYYVIYISTQIKSFSFVPKLAPFSEIWKYFKESFSVSVAFYGQFFVFEINTYFAALFPDVNQVAIWIIVTNVSAGLYFFNIGISFAVRNLIGFKLAKHNFKQAKQDMIIYLIYLLIFGVFMMALLLLGRERIAKLFTSDPKLQVLAAKGFVYGSLFVLPTVVLYSLNTILRILKHGNFQSLINSILQPIFVFFFSYFLGFVLKMETYGLLISFSVSNILSTLILAHRLLFVCDWSNVMEEEVKSISSLMEKKEGNFKVSKEELESINANSI